MGVDQELEVRESLKTNLAAGSGHGMGMSCLSFSKEQFWFGFLSSSNLIVLCLLFCHRQMNLPFKIHSYNKLRPKDHNLFFERIKK